MRRGTGLILFVLLFALSGLPAMHALDNVCDPGEAPDIIIGDIQDKGRYGVVGDVTGFAIGNYSCNLGTCEANWFQYTPEHPLFGQNMFRLKNGRLEQIGQSWLKHAFSALQTPFCSSACQPGPSTALGVNCADPYTWTLNGAQNRLGPKFEVDANSGVFPFPPTNGGNTGDAIYKRLQVHHADLDPAQNAGAQYLVELQVIAHDDSLGKNQHNNASYRPINVTGASGNYDFTLTGTTVRQKTGVEAWRDLDSSVVITNVTDGEGGRIIVGAKTTLVSGNTWHYEYAVQNMNSRRGVGSFAVPVPSAAVVTGLGFHDVDYHSGEPFDGTNWPGTAGPGQVSWTTTPYSVNPNANALRWGTLYNFRFDADVPPDTGQVMLGLFLPGALQSATTTTLAPRMCDQDGICDPGETCSNCASDCASQGGGAGCCGNGTCEVGENPCRCAADCGSQSPSEIFCGNGIDEDCDGQADCADFDCCTDAVCQGADGDSDGYAVCDCDDANPQVWKTPGEALDLRAAKGPGIITMVWSPPLAPGGTATTFDALRSADPGNFGAPATCLSLDWPSIPSCWDAADPGAGQIYFYLVRATNTCPAGAGTLGAGTSGQPRTGRSCP